MSKHPYPKKSRLLRRDQFISLSQSGSFFSGRILSFQWKKSQLPSSCSGMRLGITVTKRYGDAVQRNRIKRLLREVFRLYILPQSLCIDVNVKPKSKAINASFMDIKRDFEFFLSCFETGLSS